MVHFVNYIITLFRTTSNRNRSPSTRRKGLVDGFGPNERAWVTGTAVSLETAMAHSSRYELSTGVDGAGRRARPALGEAGGRGDAIRLSAMVVRAVWGAQMVRREQLRDGNVKVIPLANFVARIVRDIL